MVRKVLQISIPFVWFGAVAAISFMEAPLKFQAPGITIPLGLGIGRLVFFALNKIEIILAVVFLVSLLRSRSIGRTAIVLFALIAVILVLETVWLLPWLDARAELVITGAAEPFSRMHFVYIGLDAIKLVMLMALGISMTKTHLTS